MPLQKLLLKPGVNRENTRYTNEGGWYECDKIRFRQGNPEVIGGWKPYSLNTFLGVCRSIWNWTTLDGQNLIGVGTNLKYYVNQGSNYYDITPVRATATLGTNPFTGNGTTTVTVNATAHGALIGDFVTFSGVTGAYATLLNTQLRINTVVNANTYTVLVSSAIPAGATGGNAVTATYQISVGTDINVPSVGWGSGAFGGGVWGVGEAGVVSLRIWSQSNYGQDLILGYNNSAIYYWQPTGYTFLPAKLLSSLGGTVTFTVASPTVVTLTNTLTENTAVKFSSTGTLPTGIVANTTYYLFNVSGLTANLLDATGNLVNVTAAGTGVHFISLLVDVPTTQTFLLVSDASRFVFAFGANDYGSGAKDRMLLRWSDQENPLVWTPDATNQAGSLRLSHGSEIVTAVQTRQEVLVFTDSSLYSMQYLGPPIVWGTQILADNISIAGANAVVIASGVVYWMGIDKFYTYDGRTQTLKCDLRRHVFNDFNLQQRMQVCAGTIEAFNEVWWFYCSLNAQFPDKYVVYNYEEKVWYYGTMNRTAWYDSGLSAYPIAATYNSVTQQSRLISHENGLNDNTDGTDNPINAYVSSSEFDIQDGHNFGFIWRILPDLTFSNSLNAPDGSTPRVTMSLTGLNNSGSGYVDTASSLVSRTNAYVVEQFTGQIYTRLRGRQMVMRIESNQVNTSWQLGAPRIDIRNDGRR